jgi:hypothetical protein
MEPAIFSELIRALAVTSIAIAAAACGRLDYAVASSDLDGGSDLDATTTGDGPDAGSDASAEDGAEGGAPPAGSIFPADVAVDPTGRAFVVGSFVGDLAFGTEIVSSTGVASGFVAAIDPGGAAVWLQVISSDSLGEMRDIAVTATGTTFATGNVEGLVSFDGNALPTIHQDVLVLAHDRAGSLLWWHAYGADYNAQPSDVAWDPLRGQVIVGGLYLAFASDPDFDGLVLPRGNPDQAFVVAASETGTMQWGRRLACSQYANVIAVAAGVDRVCIVGRYELDLDVDDRRPVDLTSAGGQDGFVAGLAPDGTVEWSRSLGGTGFDAVVGVVVIEDDCVVTARTDGTELYGPGRIVVARYGASSPDAIWSSTYAGDATQIASAMIADVSGDVYVLGTFAQPSWEPAPGHTVTSAGARDGFLARHDDTGAMVSLRAFGSAADDSTGGLALTPSGDVMVTMSLGAPSSIPGSVVVMRGGTDAALITLAP